MASTPNAPGKARKEAFGKTKAIIINMKEQIRKILSVALCALLLFSGMFNVNYDEHVHFKDDRLHAEDAAEHDGHEHEEEEFNLFAACEDILEFALLLFAAPVSADYEDGVNCDYCGGWRYDDWKCDNGDHCGEGADGSCYEEHHCGYCGACEEDHELCDDCGNCLEDCCECDEKCRGCYETSGDVCDVCGEKCTECVDFICDDCGICAECAGNELYCSQCMLCIGCADWICYCGEGCSNCAQGCEHCYEKCTSCAEDELCTDCGTCFDCVGGEGNYCSECMLCKFCTEYICECGRGCVECVLICEQCKEKCEECADGGICKDCGVCFDCVGGDGNYCINCDLCKFCVDYVCVGCGEGCSECAIICPECGEKCESCADDQLCGDCEVCFECRGGEGNYCSDCGLCKMCVEYVCSCGNGCSECSYVCAECGEKCTNCAEEELCIECGICFDCVGGEGNYCSECLICKNCVDQVCYCGDGCSNCSVICIACSEKCENCADDELCAECERCFDCAGGEYCAECGECIDCVEYLCICQNGCNQCAEVICEDCNEKCSNCAPDELCTECGTCRDCVGGDDNFCDTCSICKFCVDYICVGCSGGCSNCVDVICEECGEKCSNCASDELCTDCGVCRECVGGDGSFCDTCQVCKNCVDYICFSCGQGCSNCAAICFECGEKCSECSDGEVCSECGKCVDCAGSDSFCINCGLCSDCGLVCPCGEGCENCADMCPDCNEKCSNCSDEFCASCDICRECVGDMWCEDCELCGNCTEICEDCGIICRDCAENVCEGCGKCSGCIDEFCPDCGICIDCADIMCRDCYYCGDCADNLCIDCGEYCSDCAYICDECGKCENCVEICFDCELCEDCCAQAAADMGCDHAICPEGAEWKKHYCSEGGHCAGESSEIENDEDEHWTVCGSGCDIRLNSELHTFGAGEVIKEATKKAYGMMKFTCTVCDFAKEEVIPMLSGGHTHEYDAIVTEPTCSSGGYTTHTCECGHSYTDMQTSAVKHSYIHRHTESEHWQECEYCHITTEKAAHKLGSWVTVVKAGYTFRGEKQRECKICKYTLKESIPALDVPGDKLVVIIPEYDKYVPSESSPDDTAPSTDPSGEVGSNNSTENPNGSDSTPTISIPVTKEFLTKGEETSVPTLPTLPPTEDGNLFEGWVNKATGETVKKGDKLTENIEIEPVWRDCGKDNHTDANDDNNCDDCGYIMVKPSVPDDTDGTDTAAPQGSDSKDAADDLPPIEPEKEKTDGFPTWAIILISVFAVIIAACGCILGITLKKKK